MYSGYSGCRRFWVLKVSRRRGVRALSPTPPSPSPPGGRREKMRHPPRRRFARASPLRRSFRPLARVIRVSRRFVSRTKMEPSVVPRLPRKKHHNTLPVHVMTRLRSAVSSKSGTARGRRNLVTSTYAGATVGMTPMLLRKSARRVERRLAPPTRAPQRCLLPHRPNDDAHRMAAHMPHWSVGWTRGQVTVARPSPNARARTASRGASRSTGRGAVRGAGRVMGAGDAPGRRARARDDAPAADATAADDADRQQAVGAARATARGIARRDATAPVARRVNARGATPVARATDVCIMRARGGWYGARATRAARATRPGLHPYSSEAAEATAANRRRIFAFAGRRDESETRKRRPSQHARCSRK